MVYRKLPDWQMGGRLVEPITKWVIVIAGYLQSEGTPNGMIALWRDLHARQAGPSTRVEFRAWDDRPGPLAELIWRLRPRDGVPEVLIAAYSWGGASAQNLARELGRRGLSVDHMLLSDAVYRHAYWLGNWRALVPWSVIEIPANVERVTWFRQYSDRPQGHDLRAADPSATRIDEAQTFAVSHTYMDDLPAFHYQAITAVEGGA